MKALHRRAPWLRIALPLMALADCSLSAPTVGGYPIVCSNNGDCLHGERCDLIYGICVGIGDGGGMEDGGPGDGGSPCTSSDCFGNLVLTPTATDVAGTLFAGANQPLPLFAELKFAAGVSSAPAPAAINLSVSMQGADAGLLTMALDDGGPGGYRYQLAWPTAGVPQVPFTFVAFLTEDGGGGVLTSNTIHVTVDNTPPTLTLSLAGLVDGGPALPRDFQQTATLAADDHGGSGIATGSFLLSGTGVPSSSTASWPVSASGTATVKGRDLLLDTGANGLAGTFTLTAQVRDMVGNQSAPATLAVPVTRLKWKLLLVTGPTAKAIDSSPVIGSRGRIYVGGNDFALHAVSPSGTLLWTYLAGDRITATPAVHVLDAAAGTEIVYAPSQDSNVHAVVGADGGLLSGWTMLSAQPTATAPNTPTHIVNSAAISPNETAVVIGDDSGHIFSVRMDTGVVTGSYPQLTATPTLQGSTAVSIVGSTSLAAVVGGQDKNVYVFSDVTVSKQSAALLSNSDSIDTLRLGGPAVVMGAIWVGAQQGAHYLTNALSTLGDSQFWPSTGYVPSIVIGVSGTPYASRLDGSLVGVSDGGISTSLAPSLSAPPTIGVDANVYMATTNGKIASVRADGSIQWEGALTNVAINSAPMIDPCNETLYVGSSDGYLFAVITDSAGLDPGPWPHFRHDYQGTGNASLTGAVDCANHL